MPPDKTYSAAEIMGMNRRDRRRIGKQNGVKIPGIQDKPVMKREKSEDDMAIINKILNEKNPLQK